MCRRLDSLRPAESSARVRLSRTHSPCEARSPSISRVASCLLGLVLRPGLRTLPRRAWGRVDRAGSAAAPATHRCDIGGDINSSGSMVRDPGWGHPRSASLVSGGDDLGQLTRDSLPHAALLPAPERTL